MRDRRLPHVAVAGGVAAALVLALLVASIGSQTFYPREGAVPMWCAIGLALRAAVARARVRVRRGHELPDPWPARTRAAWRRPRRAGAAPPPMAVASRAGEVQES